MYRPGDQFLSRSGLPGNEDGAVRSRHLINLPFHLFVERAPGNDLVILLRVCFLPGYHRTAFKLTGHGFELDLQRLAGSFFVPLPGQVDGRDHELVFVLDLPYGLDRYLDRNERSILPLERGLVTGRPPGQRRLEVAVDGLGVLFGVDFDERWHRFAAV